MARDDVAQTEGEIVALAIRRFVNHPAVIVAGLQQPLQALAAYVKHTERRLTDLETELRRLRTGG